MAVTNLLGIAREALFSSQAAIDVTTKNIINANNEGYTRRRSEIINLSSNYKIGNNTSAEELMRVRKSFIDNRLYLETQDLVKYESNELVLKQIESFFGESSDSGLQNILLEFWNSWGDLVNDPENLSLRSIVRDKGAILANTFNRIYGDLTSLKDDIKADLNKKVDSANQILSQIQNINKRVDSSASADLLDERDSLIRKLSELMNVEVRENSSGAVSITSGGKVLVSGGSANRLVLDISREDGAINIFLNSNKNENFIAVNSGEMGSLLQVHNKYISDYIDELNILAISISNAVNDIHRSGYTVSGETGINFFEDGISNAGQFKVNEEIVSNPLLIAVSSSPNEPWDASIGQAIFNLQYDSVINNTTITDFYGNLVNQIGSDIQESTFYKNAQEMVVENLQNQRDSISSVSLDEEITKLIQYENSYKAAARLVSTVDAMFQTILDM